VKFYVVHTYTGREKRVKELVEKAIERLNQPGLFGRVIMPADEGGAGAEVEDWAEERRLYPGYIVVEMELNEQSLSLINSIPGVTHLLGTKTEPLALSEEEVTAMLSRSSGDATRPSPRRRLRRVRMSKWPRGRSPGSRERSMSCSPNADG
jgi:Transcription antiterminator